MARPRLRLPVFYAFLTPVLVLSLLNATGIGSSSVGWPMILRVAGFQTPACRLGADE